MDRTVSIVHPRRGLVLVVVIGILGVLAVLGTAFVLMARLERRASQGRIHATQAYFLARSGLEDALARIEAGQAPYSAQSRYLGEDWDGDGTLLTSAEDAEPERAGQRHYPASVDREDCPLRHALRPSFWARALAGELPELQASDGVLRGYTGALSGGSPQRGGHCYAIRVEEPGIYVNGGELSSAGEHPGTYDTTLKRILGNLVEEIRDAEAGPKRGGGSQAAYFPRADGERLVTLRPAGGWTSFDQIRDQALGGDRLKIAILRPYLALRAWVDRKVVIHNLVLDEAEVPQLVGKFPRSWTEYATGNGEFDDFGSDPWTFSGLRTGVPALEARAPVTVSWLKAHPAAFAALVRDLRGIYLDTTGVNQGNELGGGSGHGDDCVGNVMSASIPPWLVKGKPLDVPPVKGYATKFGEYPWEIASIGDLATFVSEASADLIFTESAMTQAWRDMIVANFDPNTDLNAFNPNLTMWRSVDKSGLTVHSTELAFLPVHGYRVSSLGRVVDVQGRLLAERTLSAELPYGVARLTTQREFVCEDLGDLDVPGDERGLRLPGQFPYLGLNQGLGKSWGHAALANPGIAVQSYPAPYVQVGGVGAMTMSPLDCDGSLQLATVETLTDDLYGVTDPIVKDMKMLARFDTGMDLDWWDGDRRMLAYDQICGDDLLANGLMHVNQPISLRPDGCYVERRRAPAYRDAGNANGFHGVMSFWVKGNYETSHAQNPSSRGHPLVQWTNGRNDVPPDPPDVDGNQWYRYASQFFMLGQAWKEVDSPDESIGTADRYFCHFESGHAYAPGTDSFQEHDVHTGPPALPFRARRWRLVTFFWDFLAKSPNDSSRILVDRGLPGPGGVDSEERGGHEIYGGLHPDNDPALAQDITAPGSVWAGEDDSQHCIVLGRRTVGWMPEGAGGIYWNDWERVVGYHFGMGADSTMDEFAIWDFGGAKYAAGVSSPADPEVLVAPDLLARKRYEEGRYYKESAYPTDGVAVPPGADLDGDGLPDRAAAEYFTPPLSLPGAAIRRLGWTLRRPKELPGDYVEMALTTPAGDAYAGRAAACRSVLEPLWSRDRADWRLAVLPPGPFRIQVVFRREVPIAADTPIIDTPVLDDLTVLSIPPGGWVRNWREGE